MRRVAWVIIATIAVSSAWGFVVYPHLASTDGTDHGGGSGRAGTHAEGPRVPNE